MDWKNYHSYDTMMQFLDELQASNSDGLVHVSTIGKTYEGRDIKLIKIGHGKNNVFVDSGKTGSCSTDEHEKKICCS